MNTSIVRLITTVTVASAIASTSVYAIGIPKMPKGGSAQSAPAVSSADFEKLLGETSSNVLSARIQFNSAKDSISEAIGLKVDTYKKEAEALAAVSGAATDAGKKVAANKDSSNRTAEADKMLKEALEKADDLSVESKAKFAEGTVKFVGGVVLEKQQIETIKNLVDQGKSLASSASPMEKPKVLGMIKPASEMATMVPGDVKEALTVLGLITKFATKHKISIPSLDEKTEAIGDL